MGRLWDRLTGRSQAATGFDAPWGGKVTGRGDVAVAPQHNGEALIHRNLIPQLAAAPGSVQAKLSREYGQEVRVPMFDISYITRPMGLYDETNGGMHGVVRRDVKTQQGPQVPMNIYAGTVFRRQIPPEWSAPLVRDA